MAKWSKISWLITERAQRAQGVRGPLVFTCKKHPRETQNHKEVQNVLTGTQGDGKQPQRDTKWPEGMENDQEETQKKKKIRNQQKEIPNDHKQHSCMALEVLSHLHFTMMEPGVRNGLFPYLKLDVYKIYLQRSTESSSGFRSDVLVSYLITDCMCFQ